MTTSSITSSNLSSLIFSGAFAPPQIEVTDELLAAKSALVAALGYGEFSTKALFDAGANWPMIHKLTDARLIRYSRASEAMENGHCYLYYLLTY